MEFEYIYALQNKSFGAHHIKIGKTKQKPVLRARELYQGASGVPEPFDVALACQVADCTAAERKIHKRLEVYRSNNRREFFIIPIDVARMVIVSICQQINQSSNCFVEDPIVIDSRELSKSDKFSDDGETEDLHGMYWLKNLDDLQVAPPGTSLLSNEQKQRAEIISAVFFSILPSNVEDWATSFSRDMNPEVEISVWENITKAFLKIDQVKYLSDNQKKEALSLLLLRSMMSVSQVLEGHKLSTLSKKVAKEILREYEAKLVRMVVSRHPLIRQP